LARVVGVSDGFLEFIGSFATVNVKTVVTNKSHNFLMVVTCIDDDGRVTFVCFCNYCSGGCEFSFY
jgi:hypothetical protein